MNVKQKKLRKLAEELRNAHQQSDLMAIVELAHQKGLELHPDDLRFLAEREGPKGGHEVLPAYVHEFIVSSIRDLGVEVRSFLDVSAGLGVRAHQVVAELKPRTAITMDRNLENRRLSELLGYSSGLDWRPIDPLVGLADLEIELDLVAGGPLFQHERLESLTVESRDETIEFRDRRGFILLLQAARKISRGGIGFFIVPQSFVWKGNRKNSVYANLERVGLFVDAIFTLPSGTLTKTNLVSQLVVIRKEEQSRLFVGELTRDSAQILTANWIKRREGSVPQHGILTDKTSYRSLRAILLEKEVATLARRMNLSSIALSEIEEKINSGREDREPAFEEVPNAIYLPKIGTSPAVSSPTDFHIKPKNYFQIVLDSDKVFAPYVAGFFNSNLGEKVRESLSSGFIPRITKSRLREAVLYLPHLEKQTDVARIDGDLDEIMLDLAQLQRKLWNNPWDVSDAEKVVDRFQREESLTEWIDTLPFPLASILWRYGAEVEHEKKLSHLLNFFEALAQYVAVLMLSAYASAPEFYRRYADRWLDSTEEYKEWYKIPTWGSWNVLAERLAKTTRRFLSRTDMRERVHDLFGHPDREFLEALISKNLFTLLRETSKYRNRWKGHSGIVGEEEHGRRLTQLESYLDKLRQLMADKHESALLLSPGTSTYSEGVYGYQVKALKGAHTPAQKLTRKTVIPMDVNKLYVLHDSQVKPIALLPFFCFVKRQNAFYFYNRLEDGKQVRWISYHFEAEAEIVRSDDAVLESLRLLDLDDVLEGDQSSSEHLS